MRSTSAFVGRTDESGVLCAQLQEPGTATFVLGEAGMGKSRLVREVVGAAADHQSLLGMSWQGSTATPYFPWIQIAAAAARLLESASSDIEGHAQDLTPLFPGASVEARFDNDQLARDLLGIGVAEFLRVVAGTQNTLSIIIEDAHAADPDSIELATWVVRQRLPLAVVVTARPYESADAVIRTLLDDLAAECSHLSLAPLGGDAVTRLLENQGLNNADAVEALRVTRGVPLAVHNWIDARRSTAGSSFRPSHDGRLDRLDSATSNILGFAALIGNEFDISTVGEAVGESITSVIELLQQPLRSGLIHRVEPTLTRYAFDHEAIREQVADALGATQRATRHQRILDVLLSRDDTPDQDVATLAHHASFAAFVGDPSLAVELNMRAGDHALAHSAPSMARRHFDRAIELAELASSPSDVRIRAELSSARAMKAEGNPEFDRAVTALLERLSDPKASAEAFVDATLLLPSNWSSLAIAPEPDPRTVMWLERALERVGAARTKRRAQVLIEIGIHRRHGIDESARGLINEAFDIAQELGDVQLEAYIYASVQWLTRTPGEIETVLRQIDEFESRATGGSNEVFVLSGVRITTLLRAGAFNLARRELDRLETALAPLPPFVAWAIGRWRVTLLHVRGDYVGTEAAALAAFQHAEGSPFEAVAFEYLSMQLAVVLRDQVQMESAEPMLSEFVRTRPDYAAYRAAYAWLLSDLGRHDEARRQLAQLFSRRLLFSDETVVEWVPLATMAATAAAELGEVEWCKECVELLEPFKDEWIVWGTGIVVDGPVRLRRGLAAIVAGDLETARDDLRIARQQIMGAGARAFLPVLLHHEARLAVADGLLAEAVELATSASKAAGEIGLVTAAEVLAAMAFNLASTNGVASSVPDMEVEATLPGTNGSSAVNASLTRVGATWNLGVGEVVFTISHVKGLLALAELIHHPSREIHVVELSAVVDGTSRGGSATPQMSSGEVEDLLLDDVALRQYRERVDELQDEIAEAQDFNDIGRESVAQTELDFILDELRRATGLGGKSRRTTSSAERARVRVTKSLRTAIARVSDVAPAVGTHLSNNIQTGMYCSYSPDGLSAIRWSGPSTR